MDHTEDLSARVLLKHILNIEPPRTPLTRSTSRAQSTSGTSGPRRSNRLSKKDAGAQTPQDILRRSLKHKIRESISRKSLPATRRRTTSVVLKKTNTPGPASMLFDDGDTPRHILKNILLTEPVKSPVVHEEAGPEVPQLPSANSSLHSKRPSMELSGLDLPDITIGNAVSTVKGLSRKRPRRSLNVTAFEKRLKDGNDVEENEESMSDHSSLSLSSSTSLSLKTPFMDIRTEKKGLQRRVSNRRKISEEEFGAAVNKRQMGNDHGMRSFALAEQGLSETVYSEGFTLGLSKLSEPDITTDIVNCNTALYAQTDAMTSNFSTLATQDKPTVMASQLQREMEQSQLDGEKSVYAFPTEEGILTDSHTKECVSTMSQSQKELPADESQNGEEKSMADCQPEDAATMSKSEEDEELAISQTSENDDEAESEEEENAAEPQTEDADSQTEEDAATRSQSEEEDFVADTQIEEDAVDAQSEEDVAANSQSEKEDDAEEYQSDQEVPVASSQSEEEDGVTDFQTKDDSNVMQVERDEEQATKQLQGNLEDISQRAHRSEGGFKGNVEYISRRAHLSEGGFIIPALETEGVSPDTTEAGMLNEKSKARSANDLHSSMDIGSGEISQPHFGIAESAESSPQKDASSEADPDADKENSFHLQMTHENDSLKEAAAQEPDDQEEESEEEEEDDDDEEENEDIPMKTPAFVKEKRIIYPDPLASPVLKNIQSSHTSEGLPGAKPKPARQRKTRPAQREPGLPKSYLMNVFKHFAKTRVSTDVYPVLKEIMDKFFDRLAKDLEAYALHARRKTIEVEDAELLLKRQGYVNDKVPVEVLIEKYLRMEQRKLLIPIATSGNVVIPKKRR